MSVYVDCVICVYDVIVVLILEVIPIVRVDGVIDVIDGRAVDGLVILSADGVEFYVSANREVCVVGSDVNVSASREVCVVGSDVNVLIVHCDLLGVVGHVVNANDVE